MNSNCRVKKPLGFTELKRWLRHRHPMVFLDRILDHEPGQFLTAVVAVSGGLDCMAGHFPERAIYPGSHLMQAFAQAGIILFQMSTALLADDELTLISSVEARFLKVVVPGDRVELNVQVDRLVENTFHFSGRAMVDGSRAAALRAGLVRTPVSTLGSPLW